MCCCTAYKMSVYYGRLRSRKTLKKITLLQGESEEVKCHKETPRISNRNTHSDISQGTNTAHFFVAYDPTTYIKNFNYNIYFLLKCIFGKIYSLICKRVAHSKKKEVDEPKGTENMSKTVIHEYVRFM